MDPNQAPSAVMQGIVVPASSVNPEVFFRNTRRLNFLTKSFALPAWGGTENVQILQTGVIAGLTIKFSGTLTVNLAAGTAATTARWPYDLLKAVRFTANGQSNLINCSGWKLKAREMMQRGDLSDRGVARGIGGASPGTSRTQGTLSMSSEEWGVGQNVTAIPGAPTNYPVELEWHVPIAFDHVHLLGAVFAQTSSTDLNLALDIATQAELFTLTGAATAVLTGTFKVEAIVYSIPQGPNGDIVVPDLSAFHSLIQTRVANPAVGANEVRLTGQGVGRQLLRVFWQVWNGATPAPLVVDATNFTQLGWRFGGNDTPEIYSDGRTLRQVNERTFNSDLGAFQGIAALDFASENAFRDSIDQGAATELRLLIEIAATVSPALSAPAIEYVQETVFAGATGA